MSDGERSVIGLRERLASGPTILADGAMGSLLQSRGFAGGLERLNLEAPDAVRRIHLDYLEAGAEILWTNSFGGSPLRLAADGLEERTGEVNRAAARIAREAVGDRAWVAGSVGPCGVPLAPVGDLDPEVLVEGARRQVRGLADGGVDAIAIETMMDLEEAVLVLGAAREAAPDLPILVTLTFTETLAGLFTPWGNPPEKSAARLVAAGADVVGANCGTGPEPVLRVVRAMREATDAPLLARPNAGMPVTGDGGTAWPETPGRFAAAVRGLVPLAAIVGGCCGTTPAHIERLASAL